jgi:hypothetical protein
MRQTNHICLESKSQMCIIAKQEEATQIGLQETINRLHSKQAVHVLLLPSVLVSATYTPRFQAQRHSSLHISEPSTGVESQR